MRSSSHSPAGPRRSPTTCTAYRWPSNDKTTHFLVSTPDGILAGGWASSAEGTNAAISSMAQRAGCSLTVIYPRHPNDVEEVQHG